MFKWIVHTSMLIYFVLQISVLLNTGNAQQESSSSARGRFAPQPVEEIDIITKSNKYAVIVGVNTYSGQDDLTGCVNDAKSIAAELEKLGFDVELITDNTQKKPQKKVVEDAIEEMCRKANETDTIFFSFAGHGVVSPSSLRGTAPKPEGYLLPIQFNKDRSIERDAISIQKIKNQFYTAKAQFRILFMDACQSGSQLLFYPGRNEDGTMSNSMFDSLKGGGQAGDDGRGLYILSACLQNQLAYENRKTNQGYFTSYLIKGLQGAASDYEGEISVYSLVDYVSKNTQKTVLEIHEKTQTPQLLSEGVRLVLGQVPPQQIPHQKPSDIEIVQSKGYSYLSDGMLAKYNAINDAYSSAVLDILYEINPEIENYPKSLNHVLVRASQFILNKRSDDKVISSQTVDQDYLEVEINAEVNKEHLLSVAAQQGLIPYDVMRQHGLIHELKAGLYIPGSSSDPNYDDRLREQLSDVFNRLQIPFVPALTSPSNATEHNCNLIIEAIYSIEPLEKRGKLFQSSLTMGLKSFPVSPGQVTNRDWLTSMNTETVTGMGISQGTADNEAFSKITDSVESFINETIYEQMQQNS